jgi:hypothetical protein
MNQRPHDVDRSEKNTQSPPEAVDESRCTRLTLHWDPTIVIVHVCVASLRTRCGVRSAAERAVTALRFARAVMQFEIGFIRALDGATSAHGRGHDERCRS